MSLYKHNELRRAVFGKSFNSATKLEYILGVLLEHGSMKQSELQKYCREDLVISSGMKDNYIPDLVKLKLIVVARAKGNKTWLSIVMPTELTLLYFEQLKELYS